MLLTLTGAGQEIVRSRRADRIARLSRLADQLTDEERAALPAYARVLARLTKIAAASGGRAT